MKSIAVGGLHCPKCVASVTKVLAEVPGLSNVTVNLEKGVATFDGTAEDEVIKKAIDAIGFIPGAIS